MSYISSSASAAANMANSMAAAAYFTATTGAAAAKSAMNTPISYPTPTSLGTFGTGFPTPPGFALGAADCAAAAAASHLWATGGPPPRFG